MKIVLGMILIGLMFSKLAYAENHSPLGLWKTIDDVTGEPRSILEIAQDKDHHLYGKILKVFPHKGYSQKEGCQICKGTYHNQSLEGMIVMKKLIQENPESKNWDNGKITDPLSGKTYRCSLQVLQKDKLMVRGYIGLPLFGRSQQWIRVENVG